MTQEQMLEKLRSFSTPTVANVVATYPENPHCLGLYDPWAGRWYTDQTVHCVFPEMGARVGYAVTLVVSTGDSGHPGVTWIDLIDALWESPKPVILVCQQSYRSADIENRAGLFGGQSTALLKACGVTGVVTNGPSRDVDEMRPLGVQYVMSGLTPAHGDFSLQAINVPVSVAGMDVAPGDMVHMDEHGACKFPPGRLAEVAVNLDGFSKLEQDQARALLSAGTREDIKAAWSTRA
ncbi:MAG: RraA family protein [Chloroflexota bacterium]